MLRYSLLLLSALFSFTIYAQPAIEWQKAYGGPYVEGIAGIKQTSDGGYIMVGSTNSTEGDVSGSHGGGDVWVVKLSAAGAIGWQKCYGGSGSDNATGLDITPDGGYIFSSMTTSTNGDVTGGTGSWCEWIVKLDNAGNIAWETIPDSTKGAPVDDIVAVSDGYVYLSHVNTTTGNGTNIRLTKLNTTGGKVWAKEYMGNKLDLSYSLQKDKNNGFIICGESASTTGDIICNYGKDDVNLMKIDNAGNLVWQQNLGGSHNDEGRRAIPSLYGGYIVLGSTQSIDSDVVDNTKADSTEIWVVKINDTGNVEWQKTLGGSNLDAGYDIAQASNGDYILTGYTMSADGDMTGHHGVTDVFVAALYADGSYKWKKTIGSTKGDMGYFVVPTGDGGCMVAGVTHGNDSDGTGNGYHTLSNHNDIWLIKLGSTAGISPVEAGKLIRVYPTVATDKLFVSLPSGYEDAGIKLVNMLGQPADITVSGDAQHKTLHLNNIPGGHYLLQVIHKDGRETRKVMVNH